ncbi:MAG: hypothetical protein RIT45_2206 [Pseudomonadota bacterium]|jgi:uncharacterized protein YycO
MTPLDIPPPRARRRTALVGCLLLLWTATAGCADDDRLPTARDALAVLRLLRDSGRVAEQLESDPTFWARDTDQPLTHDERAWLLPLFASFVDQDLALASYSDRFLSGAPSRRDERSQALVRAVGVAAYARMLRERLRLLGLVSDNTAIFAALDEGSPEHGIAIGQLTRVAIETARPDAVLRLDIGVDALRSARTTLPAPAEAPKDFNQAWKLLKDKQIADKKGVDLPPEKKQSLAKLDVDPMAAEVVDRALATAEEARKAYHKIGGKLLRHIIGVMLGNEIAGVLDPIVADIALWLGDTRLRNQGKHLISEAQLDALVPTLQPGDVIVERRNWYLSNLGLPGFWPHAALFVGSRAELEAWADDDGVRALFPQGLVAHLEAESPEAFAAWVGETMSDATDEAADDGPARVIEAVSEGVVFTSLHHSCLADHVAFLRPRRSKAERAYAIAESFRHFGKPYDFDFDFQTITALVCSELVYTAYDLPSSVGARLDLDPLPSVMGRVTLPPNDIIARFDAEFGTDAQQFDFVAFLDGDESAGVAYERTAEDLRTSWLRPKWDLNQ